MEHTHQTSSIKSLLEGWITRDELAAELGVSVDTLARWETLRTGPALARVGRRVLYRHVAVLEWLESRERGTVQ
ncbi:MAG: helix-turn-helix domain-containing protein [Alphaproteobacteria bacterium]|nr:helix-turn-helix domain-containing protein [Alphaproteobacteria bacterium]